MRKGAGRAAGATVPLVGEFVNLAAVDVLAVAIQVAVFAGVDAASPVEALHIGVQLVTTRAARCAVLRIGLEIDARLRATGPALGASIAIAAAGDAYAGNRLTHRASATIGI